MCPSNSLLLDAPRNNQQRAHRVMSGDGMQNQDIAMPLSRTD